MAIANYFYNETTRKYVAVFGTIFNQIRIERAKADGTVVQDLIVPLNYGPQQKFLARLQQDPNLDRKSAISLPRMSFEIMSMAYDPERKLGQTQKIMRTNTEVTGQRGFTYVGAPYNLEFQLSIMTKYSEDAAKILEQIIPFFQPDFTQTVKLIPDIDPIDIPIILNGVTTEEIYEGTFQERRSVLYTLSFTMKGWFYGPQRKASVIKFIDTNFYSNTHPTNAPFVEGVDIRPGLDSQGNPISGQGGVTATARATVQNGLVTAVTVVNDGEGYSSNNVVGITIADPQVVTSQATAVTSNNTITSISVTEGGGYYTSTPSVSITEPDLAFTNATATATTNANNVVSAINVVNAGTFYSSANVSIDEPPAKSSVIKFGDDALWHNDYSDVRNLGGLPSNMATSAGNGYVIEFWIWPTALPGGYALRVLSFDGSNVRIEYDATTGELKYYPPFGAAKTSTETLIPNQWNHVRFEHVASPVKWWINGVEGGGGFAGTGTIVTSGTDVYVGDYIDASNNAAEGDRSFIGYLDHLSIDALTTISSNVAVPNTASTGSVLTETFNKVPAAATATVTDGKVTSITVTNPGENYTSAPNVTLTAPNASRADFQATATAVVAGGAVANVNITDAGEFYDSPTVTIDAPISNTATANVQVDSHGDITGITIINAGKGYRDAPLVTIDAASGISIPYTQIEFDDNWGIITTIVEEE
jgi:hypothetical protein